MATGITVGFAVILLISLLIFVLNIAALVSILTADREPMWKLLWVAVVWFFPILGMILYFAIGKDS